MNIQQTLQAFINPSQLSVMATLRHDSEEGEFFENKLTEYANRFCNMPKSYETDGQGDEAIAHLHYFKNAADWFITERDMEDEQHQAFGYANLGNGPKGGELGYISVEELKSVGAELDIHWTPKSLKKIKVAY